MYHSCTKYRSCTKLPCFLRNKPPHPPTRIGSPGPQLVAAHKLPFMHQCTVHAPTPVHAPNCLPCVHQTAFHAVLEPVRPSASVLGVRSDANTYVLLHLRPRVVPALRKTRCAHVYLMSVCVLLGVRSAFACAGAHATRACVQSPQRVHLHQRARAVSARHALWQAHPKPVCVQPCVPVGAHTIRWGVRPPGVHCTPSRHSHEQDMQALSPGLTMCCCAPSTLTRTRHRAPNVRKRFPI